MTMMIWLSWTMIIVSMTMKPEGTALTCKLHSSVTGDIYWSDNCESHVEVASGQIAPTRRRKMAGWKA